MKIKNDLPEKTIERLSQYRRVLLMIDPNQKQYIYSHELALMLHITPEQVRRDLMLIGYNGTLRKGYEISELIALISKLIDPSQTINVCIVGMGNLGSAIAGYFWGKRHLLNIVAGFDSDPHKINRVISNINCFPSNELEQLVKEKNIQIAILTMPPEYTREITERLVSVGIKGILNYTSTPVQVPAGVFLEEYDMITYIEKVAFFVKKSVEK